MALSAKDFYRSSNGDRWRFVRDTTSGRCFVRHKPNLSSGGRVTDTEVDEFSARTGSSPENLALRGSWISGKLRSCAEPERNQSDSEVSKSTAFDRAASLSNSLSKNPGGW